MISRKPIRMNCGRVASTTRRRCVSSGNANARQTFTPSAARRPACPPLRGATVSPEAACVLALPLARVSKGARAFIRSSRPKPSVSLKPGAGQSQLHRAGQVGGVQ